MVVETAGERAPVPSGLIPLTVFPFAQFPLVTSTCSFPTYLEMMLPVLPAEL